MSPLVRFQYFLFFATYSCLSFAAEELKEEAEIIPPKAIYKVDPTHPKDLFEKGIEGHVIIIGTVDMFGSVIDPQVESTTHDDFGIAAILACSEWIFEPATKNGVPIEIGIKIPFDFEIAFEHALNVERKREVFKKIEARITQSSDLDFAPSPRFMPLFTDFYPEELKGSGISAALSIEFVIGPDGLVYNPQVISASTDGFEEAALKAVSLIKFRVVTVEGEAAYVSMKMPIHMTEFD